MNTLTQQPQAKSNEWYTPSKYIEAARAVMGAIDLDPASCALANETVKATHYYTKEDDGLAKPWYGSVWLNPPYGRVNGSGASVINMFVTKLMDEYKAGNVKQATMLVTVRTDSAWFRSLWKHPICFSDHRLHFYKPTEDGIEKDSKWGHFFGTCFVYLGNNEQKFIEHFSQFGRIARAIDTSQPVSKPRELWEGSL